MMSTRRRRKSALASDTKWFISFFIRECFVVYVLTFSFTFVLFVVIITLVVRSGDVFDDEVFSDDVDNVDCVVDACTADLIELTTSHVGVVASLSSTSSSSK